MNVKKKLIIVFAAIFLALSLTSISYATSKISKPGEYSGYSEQIYDQVVLKSYYITLNDGTRIAIDSYHPAVDGVVVEEPYPVIWNHTRYGRRGDEGLFYAYGFDTMVKHGYVFAVVDARGTEASYGTRNGAFSPEETYDSKEIAEWFASQSWCDGNIGMWGGSYRGITQYLAATMGPSPLRAICPQKALWEGYNFVSPGGVYHELLTRLWGGATRAADLYRPPVPVDDDVGGVLAAEAQAEHVGNLWIDDIFLRDMFRDSYDERLGYMPYIETAPASFIPEIEASDVGIYHMVGWWDSFTKDQVVGFLSVDNPQKIIIGPWYHSEFYHAEVAAFLGIEHHRWNDYWLKGIDNGIMDEPPIYYYTIGAPEGEEWRFAKKWPLPCQDSKRFFLRKGRTGTVDSVNDGVLSKKHLKKRSGDKDVYEVDYTSTWPITNRYTNAYGFPFNYGDMTEHDEKGLTYTTDPLRSDMQMTGHPVLNLWVKSKASDVDFFITLEDVQKDGSSHYVTDGILRASHRATKKMQPYDHIRIPYHRSYEKDYTPLPKKPVELVIDLQPISYLFKKGNRIRLAITCAEKNTFMTPEISPAPTVSVYRKKHRVSYLSLPIVPSGGKKSRCK